jgi:hypothetical protein
MTGKFWGYAAKHLTQSRKDARYSFELEKEAEEIEQAVENVIEKGYRTADIA